MFYDRKPLHTPQAYFGQSICAVCLQLGFLRSFCMSDTETNTAVPKRPDGVILFENTPPPTVIANLGTAIALSDFKAVERLLNENKGKWIKFAPPVISAVELFAKAFVASFTNLREQPYATSLTYNAEMDDQRYEVTIRKLPRRVRGFTNGES